MIIDGESLGDMLIEAGMAFRYDGGKKTHKKWCDPINELKINILTKGRVDLLKLLEFIERLVRYSYLDEAQKIGRVA